MKAPGPVDPGRRRLLAAIGAAAVATSLSRRSWADAAAESFYDRAVVIDGLGSLGGRDGQDALNEAEIADIARSGMTAVHTTVGRVGTMPSLEAFEHAVRSIARWEREVDRHRATLARVRTAADLQACRDGGRTGLIYGLQDGVSFEDDLDRLEALYQFGIRVVQPTYNRRNLLGDGCMERNDAGLSRTGLEAIERLQDLGILVDLSHCGERTGADAIAAARRPVAFTHTGCRALVEHPRHKSDEQIRAVAETGGVTGIFVMPYLSRGRQPTAEDVIAHLEHAVEVAGEDHVAIGTDGQLSPVELSEHYRQRFRENVASRKARGIAAPFETEEGYLFASDLNSARRFQVLGEKLLQRGHGETRVRKLLGGNLQRLFADAWAG